MAKRWLHPDFSWAICLSEIAPLISCGLAKIWAQCSGGLPHCPCWFEPQQKTCPEAVNAAEWWDPATTCTNFWEQSGILTVYDRKTYIRNICYVVNLEVTCIKVLWTLSCLIVDKEKFSKIQKSFCKISRNKIIVPCNNTSREGYLNGNTIRICGDKCCG